MTDSEKNKAQATLIDPLIGPDPSDETGLGSSLVRPVTPESRSLSNYNPFHNSGRPRSVLSTNNGTVPSPEASKSPRPHINERFPGDPDASPLNQLAKEKAIADRAAHMTKRHAIRPDTIDSLDRTGMTKYHHEGPFDVTLYARNNTWESSPLAAVMSTNAEALRATPREKIMDSVRGHRPLDGVASFPPGTQDRNGYTYRYRGGDNMMLDENAGGGPYKRWPGVQYHPDDIKGVGEPAYSIERARRQKAMYDRNYSQGYEMRGGMGRHRSTRSAQYRPQAFSHDNDGRSRGFDGRLRSGSLNDQMTRRNGPPPAPGILDDQMTRRNIPPSAAANSDDQMTRRIVPPPAPLNKDE